MSLDPVVADVWVPASPGDAFRRFTDELNDWWPRATHSVSQERCARVRFEGGPGGRLVEVADDGTEHEWGRVRAWEDGRRFVVSWHPGRPEREAQEVEVVFTPERDGTRVRLTHRDWEAIGPGADATRERYAGGWAGVLATYAGSLGASTGGEG